MIIKAMMFLLIVFSSPTAFAKTRSTASDTVTAKSIYAQIKATHMVAQHHYENNNLSYSGINVSNACTLKNIPVVCGSNSSRFGISRNGTYSVTSSSGGAQVSIRLDRITYPIGRILEAQFRNDPFCSAQYNSGVITATCRAVGKSNANLATCNSACSGATSDKTGRAFVTCLQNAACIAAGITASTDDTDYASSNLGSISNVSSYSNLNAGVTIFGYVNSCHSAIVANIHGDIENDDLFTHAIIYHTGQYGMPTNSNCNQMLIQGSDSSQEIHLGWLSNSEAAFHHWCDYWGGQCYLELA